MLTRNPANITQSTTDFEAPAAPRSAFGIYIHIPFCTIFVHTVTSTPLLVRSRASQTMSPRCNAKRLVGQLTLRDDGPPRSPSEVEHRLCSQQSRSLPCYA